MQKAVRKIAVAMSGGVDSSVAALILKRKGYDVTGVYMQNWSEHDEQGYCSGEQDYLDAQKVADHLQIPLKRVVFEKEYWNNVFCQVISGYERGHTPNPDTLCNKHVKFGALFDHVTKRLDTDWLATGHYARLQYSSKGVKLLRAEDENKDQTFFLGQVSQEALQRTLFPVGDLLKPQVKHLAVRYGLEDIASKRESMGMCFVGKRNFKDFLSEYVTTPPGYMIDIDTGRVLGQHQGIHMWTYAQCAHISGQSSKYFVCQIDAETNTLYLAAGRDHPALDCTWFTCSTPHWISIKHKDKFVSHRVVVCSCRVMHRKALIPCNIIQDEDTGQVTVELSHPVSGLVCPGQFAVFYDGDECIGSALITAKERYVAVDEEQQWDGG